MTPAPWSENDGAPPPWTPEDDTLSAARGLGWGCLFSLGLWGVLGLLGWLLFG